jgi:hypothetical protein
LTHCRIGRLLVPERQTAVSQLTQGNELRFRLEGSPGNGFRPLKSPGTSLVRVQQLAHDIHNICNQLTETEHAELRPQHSRLVNIASSIAQVGGLRITKVQPQTFDVTVNNIQRNGNGNARENADNPIAWAYCRKPSSVRTSGELLADITTCARVSRSREIAPSCSHSEVRRGQQICRAMIRLSWWGL